MISGEVVVWLRRRQVLLPAVRELERLVSRVVLAAHMRFWQALADLACARQAVVLSDLVQVSPGQRVSPLERLRRGPVDPTAKALAGALRRVGRPRNYHDSPGTINEAGGPPRREKHQPPGGRHMNYRSLGRTGKQVSPLCLGAMMFGAWGEPDHETSIGIIHRALDAGINSPRYAR